MSLITQKARESGRATVNPVMRVNPNITSGSSYTHPLFGSIQTAKFTDVTQGDGSLQSGLQSRVDNRGLSTLRNQAITGQTPWLDPALQENEMGARFARQDTAKRKAQALSRPMSAQQALNAVSSQGQMGRQVDATEMQNAYRMMGQANRAAGQNLASQIGREVRATQPQAFNVSQALTERRLEDEQGFGNFNEMMRAYAARQTAQATRDSGGGGGLLGFLGL